MMTTTANVQTIRSASRAGWFLSLLILLSVCAGCVGGSAASGPQVSGAEELGVEVQGIRLSAAGYMLDFRYRVLDRDKAMPLFMPTIQPILVHKGSGARFAVPVPAKVGALRQVSMTPEVGRGYFALFANPGQFVKIGDAVAIEVGKVTIDGLVVE